jgi:tetratricopeptide (TPR) repeat protein
MKDLIAQHMGLAWVLLGALAAAILLPLYLLARRPARRQSAQPEPAGAALESAPLAVAQPVQPDGKALAGAVRDAETAGRSKELPALYLSLARCRIEVGNTADAAELLRKCILGAAVAQQKDVHASARLVLGDLAHGSGDLTTACEHWQIARALFHELKRRGEHDEAEQRMLRNGCPTDWVLTDF